MGSRMVGLGRGGAGRGGVVQFLDNVVDVPVVWVFFVVAVQLLDKAADMPVLFSLAFLDKVVDMPVVVQLFDMVVDVPVVQIVDVCVQCLDTVVDMPVVVHVVFVVLKTVEVPQLQYLDKVVDVFFVQFIDGYGRRCDHAATSGGASDSVHRQSSWTFQLYNRDGYDALRAAMKGFFGLFRPFFALFRVVPELSASFRSPRW